MVSPAAFLESVLTILEVNDSPATAPSITEFLQSNKDYQLCQSQSIPVRKANSAYDVDPHGFLVRRSTVDGALRRFAPVLLRECMLTLSHSLETAGHPGARQKHATLR